jgi:hypothetical protein
MLQVFCLDVAKVDLDLPYACMLQAYVSNIFKRFKRMFVSVSSGCCIFLQWLSNVFQTFLQVFQTLVLIVSYVFFCMLQRLHFDVLKVDRMLHMRYAWKAARSADHVWGGVGLLLVRSLVSPTH